MNSFQVKVVYPRSGYSDAAMEDIASALAPKFRASWLFLASSGTTECTLRVLAEHTYAAVPAAGRALRAAERILGVDPVEVAVITEVEAYRRHLADPELPVSLRKLAEAEIAGASA